MRESDVRRPLIRIDDPVWSQAAGLLARMRRDGVPFAVPPELEPVFTSVFRASGDEDAVVVVSARALHEMLARRSGNTVLLDAHPVYVDAMKMAPARPRQN